LIMAEIDKQNHPELRSKGFMRKEMPTLEELDRIVRRANRLSERLDNYLRRKKCPSADGSGWCGNYIYPEEELCGECWEIVQNEGR
jgi:hypothetical protein